MTCAAGSVTRQRSDGVPIFKGRGGVVSAFASTTGILGALIPLAVPFLQGDNAIGAIGLIDMPREAAKVALKSLRDMGITRIIMISGDHQKVADVVARRLSSTRPGAI